MDDAGQPTATLLSDGETEAVCLRGHPVTALRNVCLMHALERLAERFNEAGVALMVLKGAALNLTLYDRPDERAMVDLDLLVRPEDAGRASALLEEAGAIRGEALVREDFFPRFHAEMAFELGEVHPVRVDLHVRPLRPLRYSRLVPLEALWTRAERVQIGRASVWVPCVEEMLIHLAAHSALHGNTRTTWLKDIKRWADAHRDRIDWDRFLETVRQWRLTLPVREAFERTSADVGRVCSPEVMRRLARQRASWRDRLATAQAPRDATHPVAHVAVDLICTPGWRFCLAYLWAVAVPGREHMAGWYGQSHWGWLACAHLLRLIWPLIGRIPRWCQGASKIRTRTNPDRGTGVFATRPIRSGEVIARCRGRLVRRQAAGVSWRETRFGRTRRYEVTGKLRFLAHSQQPNARLSGRELVAVRPISPREEITIDPAEATSDSPADRRGTDAA